MPTVEIAPAQAVPFAHLEAVLGTTGDGPRCWCRWWLDTNAQFNAASVDEKKAALRADIAADAPRGLLATVDGAPAGWVAVAPRPQYQRLPRTRAIAAALPAEDWTDPAVWSVVCFVITRDHRRAGLSAALLAAAVDAARAGGATAVEGYPVEVDGTRDARGLYTGVSTVFERAGFAEVARVPGSATRPTRVIMRRALA